MANRLYSAIILAGCGTRKNSRCQRRSRLSRSAV